MSSSIASNNTTIPTNPPNTCETIISHTNPVPTINTAPDNIRPASNVVHSISITPYLSDVDINVFDPQHDTHIGTLGHISDSTLHP